MKKLSVLIAAFLLLNSACAKKEVRDTIIPKDPPANVPEPPATVAECKKCIVLSEQSQHRVAIADVPSKTIFWDWKAATSNVKPEHVKWFTNPSDAKVVYNGKYILTTASGGGIALIRIADKKTVFYAYAGGNPHSAELLPDGNIVSASSTGNYLMLFKVDTLNFPDKVYTKTIPIEFGHNVVWDQKNQLLWSAAMNQLKAFSYSFNCSKPDLTLKETIPLPGTEAHDLFPVYNENSLWLTNIKNVYKFDVASKKLEQADVIQANIKSVSSGPSDFPTIILRPKESWWADEVLDNKGNTIFIQSGLKIYKARWVISNTFSYPSNTEIKQCH